MIKKIYVLTLFLFLFACGSDPSVKTDAELSPNINFVDLPKFDRDLANSLKSKFDVVDVAFYEKVSPNSVPERLQKWISSAEQSGGKVKIEQPPNEIAPKDPLTIIGLLASMIGGVKTFAEYRTNKTYEAVTGRDAIISLERNPKGEVVVSKISFIKRPIKSDATK